MAQMFIAMFGGNDNRGFWVNDGDSMKDALRAHFDETPNRVRKPVNAEVNEAIALHAPEKAKEPANRLIRDRDYETGDVL